MTESFVLLRFARIVMRDQGFKNFFFIFKTAYSFIFTIGISR